ncbi:hypothetical protein [Bradyrhizobium sp. CCH5-F6]|uniref:hypothetical protein n=1 Tax=Bradyrhizobium sp. CCH5-F6 TaxID=1768753 RepID=UPI00076ADEB4|nr:hypothetical protein [Bradyrhizobium sp. CCH5-F6]
MSNVVPFPHVDGAAATSSTNLGLSRAELRDIAWRNYYAAERRLGTRPEIAHQRADEHAARFEELLANVGHIMSEVG